MKALVTGATGFVGSHLAAALVKRGDEVVCITRRPEQAAFIVSLGARPAPGSLEDVDRLAAALRGADLVFHLAGLTAAGSEREFLEANRDGTARLVDAVRTAAPGLARFVYVSSIAAVGPTARGTLLTEDAPCRPVTAYGRSKLAGEEVVRAAPGLRWTIVRPPVVYGPRDRELLRMFRIARSGFAPVFGLGRQELSLVFVTDLADGIARAGGEPAAVGRTYHLAHPEIVTARQLARAVGRAARGGAPLILPVPGVLAAPIVRAISRAAAAAGRRTVVSEDKLAEFLAPAWGTSVALAERELAWRPPHDLEHGAIETAAWYRAERLLA
ncbi:MAG TPA: NAD-dependent epimerase/dehydratase family protein [Gemmatimonadales bacterium]|nr:NAD-dependent epimerase/dehydratase family protein [Gemmatimonadales bacterium]